MVLRGVIGVVSVLALATPAVAAEPVVSVWYRGQPSGTPRLDDLAAIRALGFHAVTWPTGRSEGLPELRRMAGIVGLAVLTEDRPRPLSIASAIAPGDQVDVVVAPDNEPVLSALVWRAVAHGARTISFDGGQESGAGLTKPDGTLVPWARPAIAIARQLSANARLTDVLRPGPAVAIDPPARAGFDLVLLDGERSWVIVATNTSREPQRGTAGLPAVVPYAIWVSWTDGRTLAMLGTPAGPRWTFTVAAGDAQVFIIDKR